MEARGSQRESGWLWMIACQHSRAVQVHPGLTSWVILSRPCGTGLGGNVDPALPRISCTLLQTHLRMRLSSRKAARGSLVPPNCTGNPGTCWATISRPFGTVLEQERIDSVEPFAFQLTRSAGSANAIVGATPHRFRPRYALANLGHPSGSDGFCYETDSFGTDLIGNIFCS
jgi:hypothetical protein